MMRNISIRYIYMVAALIFTVSAQAQMKISFGGPATTKLNQALMAITNLYVDSVDDNSVVEDGIRGMIEKLDPHSSFVTAKEMKASAEALQGNFDGIGVQFNIVEDTLLVIQPTTNGPSEKVGIMAGDRIVTVNDTAIAGVKMSKGDIMSRLRGPKGTKVRLGVVRRGISDMLHFTVVRDKIPVHSIDAYYMIRPTLGYVRISGFGAQTHGELMTAIEELKKQGMTDLIIDLQSNSGGYLQSATSIANEFLSDGDLVVYTEGRVMKRSDFKANGRGSMTTGKICVLINEFSASASEILSGAIQDNDRGVIVGRRSFGKGLVQRPITFEDGSELRLTVAHYYTPSGRCIQKPYTKGDKSTYNEDILDRYKHGEMVSADSIHFADSLRYYTLKKHRPVYGGGGIMPDYFVPMDTTRYTDCYRKIVAKGCLTDVNLKYIDRNRKQLKKDYPDFKTFQEKYTVSDELLAEIYKEGEKKDVKPKDDEERAKTDDLLRLQMRALIARNIWDMTEYFTIINETDPVVMKAVELMTKTK